MNEETKSKINDMISRSARRITLVAEYKPQIEFDLLRNADCEETRQMLQGLITKINDIIIAEQEEIKQLRTELETGVCRERHEINYDDNADVKYCEWCDYKEQTTCEEKDDVLRDRACRL